MTEPDELIERVVRALKPLPPLNASATAQILAVVRTRAAHAPRPWTRAMEWLRQPTLSAATAGMLAAAALVAGFVTRGAIAPVGASAPADTPSTLTAPLVPAANAPVVVTAIPVPITFDAAGASKVSIVGDFNDWNSAAAPLKRFGTNGPWTTTVKVMPGRHLYAFMVDGKLVVDPRAPSTRDLDYGGEASVMMVNTP
ncbi:MAG: glycogen-binding domain-containing protein [Gemmatimonadaceae bacterium]